MKAAAYGRRALNPWQGTAFEALVERALGRFPMDDFPWPIRDARILLSAGMNMGVFCSSGIIAGAGKEGDYDRPKTDGHDVD